MMQNAKNAKLPVQGTGVIRNVNRSQVEGGVEAAGFWGSVWDKVKEYGPQVAKALLS